MSWEISGEMLEVCNCTLLCPCWLDVSARPDQGWCGTAIVFAIERGHVDGLDLTGRKVVLAAEIPGAFAGGNFTVRLYVDDGASAEQRHALEQLFTGQLGGPMATLGPAVTTLLPTRVVEITMQRGDVVTVTVSGAGRLQWAPRHDPGGRATKVEAAEGMAVFAIADGQPAKTAGSQWSDPDLRSWGGDSGMVSRFTWRG
ncbi:MAG: DUF1326 domain-containing protein [Thermomicrobium sp.]|nr:DUF1326 domain-containing protein [Thermomicrobium sp.]